MPPSLFSPLASIPASPSRFKLALESAGQTACRGALRLTRGAASTASAKYTVAAGKNATVRLALSSAGRALLRSTRRCGYASSCGPRVPKLVARSLTLRR